MTYVFRIFVSMLPILELGYFFLDFLIIFAFEFSIDFVHHFNLILSVVESKYVLYVMKTNGLAKWLRSFLPRRDACCLSSSLTAMKYNNPFHFPLLLIIKKMLYFLVKLISLDRRILFTFLKKNSLKKKKKLICK